MQNLIERASASSAYQIAQVYGYRGDTENAFLWLERAYDQADAGIVYTKYDSAFEGMHDDPRWDVLITKIGK
ncbi:MAG: hypothetical protein AAFQ87_04700 [Bacteroidota bacterium]